MKKTKLRKKGKEWCRVEIELDAGKLSICGSYGEIVTAKAGRKQAKEYWQSFFEESPSELGEMQQRFPHTCLHTPKQGARFVVKTDGEYHGLDIAGQDGNSLLIEHGGGKCKQQPWKAVHQLDDDGLTVTPICPSCGRRAQWRGPFLWGKIKAIFSAEMRPEDDRHCDFDAMCAPCPKCGYKYGTAWLKQELPSEVITWFNNF